MPDLLGRVPSRIPLIGPQPVDRPHLDCVVWRYCIHVWRLNSRIPGPEWPIFGPKTRVVAHSCAALSEPKPQNGFSKYAKGGRSRVPARFRLIGRTHEKRRLAPNRRWWPSSPCALHRRARAADPIRSCSGGWARFFRHVGTARLPRQHGSAERR